jgi:hypothetical protein
MLILTLTRGRPALRWPTLALLALLALLSQVA